MFGDIEKVGYLATYMQVKGLAKSELKRAMEEFGGISYQMLGQYMIGSKPRSDSRRGTVKKADVLRIGCALFRLTDMDFGGECFDYRRILKRDGGVFYKGKGSNRRSLLAAYCDGKGLDLKEMVGGDDDLKRWLGIGITPLYGEKRWSTRLKVLMGSTKALEVKEARKLAELIGKVDYRSFLEEVSLRKYKNGVAKMYMI
jgi:hypothetical protein